MEFFIGLAILWITAGILAWFLIVKKSQEITIHDLIMLVPCALFGLVALCFIGDTVIYRFKDK